MACKSSEKGGYFQKKGSAILKEKKIWRQKKELLFVHGHPCRTTLSIGRELEPWEIMHKLNRQQLLLANQLNLISCIQTKWFSQGRKFKAYPNFLILGEKQANEHTAMVTKVRARNDSLSLFHKAHGACRMLADTRDNNLLLMGIYLQSYYLFFPQRKNYHWES